MKKKMHRIHHRVCHEYGNRLLAVGKQVYQCGDFLHCEISEEKLLAYNHIDVT